MEKELVKSLMQDNLSLNNAVLVTTHVPFIISGKYQDYKEGEMVSTTLEELKVDSLANKFKEDYVRIYLNGHKYDYKLEELEIDETDRGTMKSIVFGVFRLLIHRKYLTILEGLEISLKTNLTTNNGLPLNFIANLLISLNTIYKLELTPSVLADLTQEVYINYYGKTVSYLYCMTLYQDGINRYEMIKDTLNIEHLEKDCNVFKYVLLENGPRLQANNYNNYYASLFELFAKVKHLLNINYLSEIDYSNDFGALYSPHSELLETEKLVLTHCIEETKRAKVIFSVFKNQNNPRQLIDAVNTSLNELGAYCGFNNLNKFLETTVYNATLKVPSALTILNDELTNMFVFIYERQYHPVVMAKLAKYKNYFFYEVHPAKEATKVVIINQSK